MSKGEQPSADNIETFQGGVNDFNDFISKAEGLVVVCFWAQWCAPCRRLTGMLPQMAAECSKVKFVKVDVDENPELAEKYQITGIPNVFLFKGIDEKGVPLKVAEIQGLDNTGMRDAIEKNSK